MLSHSHAKRESIISLVLEFISPGKKMTHRIPSKDIKFLRLLPLLANWIKEKKQLTDKEIIAFVKHYPEHYDPASDISLGQMFEMASHYRDHKTFGKWIQVVLSQEGKAWLEAVFRRFREMSPKMK